MFLSLYDTEEQTRECKEKQESFLRRAAELAARSSVCHHRHGCVIVRNGVIISEGYNYHTNHMEHQFTIHAEVDALQRIGGKKKKILCECELYVVRIGTDGMGQPLKYSKPCPDCTRAILKSGIKKVYFSTNDEFNSKMETYKPPPNKQYKRKTSSDSDSNSTASSSASSKTSAKSKLSTKISKESIASNSDI